MLVEDFCVSIETQGTKRDASPSDPARAIGMTVVKVPGITRTRKYGQVPYTYIAV